MLSESDTPSGAVLVEPGLKWEASIVPLADLGGREASLLRCSFVELWPHSWQLDAVRGPNGRAYRFDVYVDEAGGAARRPLNMCASLAAHPFNEVWGRLIRGPALLVPLDGAAYTLADWGQICAGVWSLDCECEEDCEQTAGTCPRVALVEANLAGPLASQVRAGGQRL